MARIVLAYSGGPLSSAALVALAARPGVEVVTLTLDLGQGTDLETVRQQARALGAVRAHVIDAREEFARDVLLPSLTADALALGRYPLVAALARPSIAARLAAVAAIEKTREVAHGSVTGGFPRPAFDVLLRAIDPQLTVIAAGSDTGVRDPPQSRKISGRPEAAISAHVNAWGRSIVCAYADAPSIDAAERRYFTAGARTGAPEASAFVDIAFVRGLPVSVNGISVPLVELLSIVDTIAGVHAVGRLERVDPLAPYRCERIEAPAAVVLHAAHAALKSAARIPSRDLSAKYVDVIERGPWHSPERAAMDATLAEAASRLTGTIRLELFKGLVRVVGRRHDAGDGHDAGDDESSTGRDASVLEGAWRRP